MPHPPQKGPKPTAGGERHFSPAPRRARVQRPFPGGERTKQRLWTSPCSEAQKTQRQSLRWATSWAGQESQDRLCEGYVTTNRAGIPLGTPLVCATPNSNDRKQVWHVVFCVCRPDFIIPLAFADTTQKMPTTVHKSSPCACGLCSALRQRRRPNPPPSPPTLTRSPTPKLDPYIPRSAPDP